MKSYVTTKILMRTTLVMVALFFKCLECIFCFSADRSLLKSSSFWNSVLQTKWRAMAAGPSRCDTSSKIHEKKTFQCSDCGRPHDLLKKDVSTRLILPFIHRLNTGKRSYHCKIYRKKTPSENCYAIEKNAQKWDLAKHEHTQNSPPFCSAINEMYACCDNLKHTYERII